MMTIQLRRQGTRISGPTSPRGRDAAFVLSLPEKDRCHVSRNPQRVDCFSVFAAAEPSALPRVLDVFTLFGVVPQRCHSCRLEATRTSW